MPESERFMAKAAKLLEQAQSVLDIDLYDETGPDSTVSAERARAAVATANVFVAHLGHALGKTIR